MSWESRNLGDVAQVVRGISYKSAEVVSTGGIPMVNLKNVSKGGGFRTEGTKQFTGAFKGEQVLGAGDLLVAATDLSKAKDVLGSPFLVPATLEGAVFSLDLVKLEPDLSLLDPKFLYFYLRSPSARVFTKSIGRGITVMHMSSREFPKMVVPVPPLDEQRQIVAELEDQLGRLDATRSRLAETKTQLEQLRASALNQYLAPGTQRMSVDFFPLVSVADVVMGQSPPGSSYNSEGKGLPFFQGKAEFTDLHPDVRKWTTEGSRRAESGDILLSVRAPVGATNIANQASVIGRGLAAIRAKEGLDQRYLLLYLKAKEQDLKAQGVGTTFAAITGKVLRQFQVPVPPLDEQSRIVAALEEIQRSLEVIGSRLSEVDGLVDSARVSVLHRAFDGGV